MLLHLDLGALRTFPLPLLVVDMALDLYHRDPALSTCHLYSSIAPKGLCRSQGIPASLAKTATAVAGCGGYGERSSTVPGINPPAIPPRLQCTGNARAAPSFP